LPEDGEGREQTTPVAGMKKFAALLVGEKNPSSMLSAGHAPIFKEPVGSLLPTHSSVYHNPAENCQEALHVTQYSIMHVYQLSIFQKSLWRSSHLHIQQATMNDENRQYDCRTQILIILWIIDILVNSDDNKQVENGDSNDFYRKTCLILDNTGNLQWQVQAIGYSICHK
jgi:hypothetical protein